MTEQLARLRQELAALERGPARNRERMKSFGLGVPEVDQYLGKKSEDAPQNGAETGLARAALHEVFAAASADASAAAGFAAGLAQRAVEQAVDKGPVMWIRQAFSALETGRLYGPGLAEIGLDPDRVILVEVRDGLSVLRAGLEAAACVALGAVILEPWGDPKALDFTATRRLDMAAGSTGVPVLLLRVDAEQISSAAHTRWRIAAAPSRPLLANAPGATVFDVTLLRQRMGPAGQHWQLEWDHEHQSFRSPGGSVRQSASLSGAVVSVPARRTAAISDPQKQRTA